MSLCVSPWLPVFLHGPLCLSMTPCGSPCLSVSPCGSLCLSMSPCGSPSLSVSPRVSLCFPVALCGSPVALCEVPREINELWCLSRVSLSSCSSQEATPLGRRPCSEPQECWSPPLCQPSASCHGANSDPSTLRAPRRRCGHCGRSEGGCREERRGDGGRSLQGRNRGSQTLLRHERPGLCSFRKHSGRWYFNQ